jgi:hypothetical protein
MLAQDIQLDENGDLAVTPDGDLGVEYSDWQHEVEIEIGYPGHYANFPFCGFAMREMQNMTLTREELAFRRQKLKFHLELDGYIVEKCDIIKEVNQNRRGQIRFETKIYRP